MNIKAHRLETMLPQPGRLTLKYIMVDPKGMHGNMRGSYSIRLGLLEVFFSVRIKELNPCIIR